MHLGKTLMGGQSFNWEIQGGCFFGSHKKNIMKLVETKEGIKWQTYPNKNDTVMIQQYFRLEKDYKHILEIISRDKHVKSSLENLLGLRILKQDLFETTLSFIISQNKNITSIRNSVKKFKQRFGTKIRVEKFEFYTFPEIEEISQISINDLKGLSLGYRESYIIDAIRAFKESELLQKHSRTNYQALRDELLKIKGVGNKVADCILVFGGGFEHITPLDVWGIRIATELYGVDSKIKYEQMSKWFTSQFGEYTAWAGQFLFEWIRENWKK